MIVWCDKAELKITSNIEPCAGVRLPLPSDSEVVKTEKRKKPYTNKRRVMWTINYKDKQYCFVIQKGYCWDGASIPYGFRWIIGAKGSDEFLIPSMVHDVFCENHEVIGHDRQLSSLVFKELLLASGVGKLRAETMYLAVNSFQALWFNGWEKR